MPTKRQMAAAERRRLRALFRQTRIAERQFAANLSGVAAQIGKLVSGFIQRGVLVDRAALEASLNRYGQVLEPWAASVVSRMQAQVSQRDLFAWKALSETIGRNLRTEVATAPTGLALQEARRESVALITSMPIEAAQRVHQITLEGLFTGQRSQTYIQEIMETGRVTRSRAKLIARTEVARTASLLTETRAKHIGSDGYIWRTSDDSDVRREHAKLEGKLVRWDAPPVAGKGKGGVDVRYHAGQGPNCRCWPEPVIPDVIR